MPKETPEQLPLIKPKQISGKNEIKDSNIDPFKDPVFKPGPKPYPTRNIYHEKNKGETESPVFKVPVEKPLVEERPMPFEESAKRLKELIKSLDEKDKKK